MSDTMRAEESLRTRQAIAGQALAGPWTVEKYDDSSAFVETTWGNMICDSVSHEEAAHIAANSPDVIMADIDEILRLRAENAKLQKDLEFVNKVAAEQHKIAKLAWGGEIPSPLPGHPQATEEDMVAMFEHLNCPWCGGSGHVEDCEEADRQVKSKLERLEKEADWLAKRCHHFCDDMMYCNDCPLHPFDCTERSKNRFAENHVVPNWRECARKAVEENSCKN